MRNYFYLVKKYERVHWAKRILVEDIRNGKNVVKDVLDTVSLVNLGNDVLIRDGDDLFKVRTFSKKLAVSPGFRVARVVLHAANNFEEHFIREQNFQQWRLVHKKNWLQYLVELMQSVHILQILAHMKHVYKFLNIIVLLNRKC